MNMFDYIAWRGDLTFEQDEFNVVDNLIFSYVCYTEFDEDFTESMTLKQACDKFYSTHTMEQVKANKSLIAKAPLVLLEMSKANRYKDLMVHDFINIIEPEKARQFSAMQFDLNDKVTYVAFRGTDDTIVGWNEDFIISYKTMQAQLDALDYINTRLNEDRQYYIGGHSKGGCLAYYGASQCDEKWQKKFLHVYNNDGPNLSVKFVSEESIHTIDSIFTRIQPAFSVFGMIYADYPVDNIVVKSDASFLMQHDATSWQILGKDFIREKDVTPESKIIKKALDDFLNTTSDEEKEIFIDELFQAAADAKFDLVSDLSNDTILTLARLIKEVTDIDENAKKVGSKLLNVFKKISEAEATLIRTNATDYIKDKTNDVTEYFSKKRDEVEFILDDTRTTILDKIDALVNKDK